MSEVQQRPSPDQPTSLALGQAFYGPAKRLPDLTTCPIEELSALRREVNFQAHLIRDTGYDWHARDAKCRNRRGERW